LHHSKSKPAWNHLGDRNEYLPTVHAFDEFHGILYHLNAMEEPYDPHYPKGDKFLAKFGPRNIIHSVATDVDDPTEDPRWGRVGKQKITDAGPLPPHPGMDSAAKVSMEDIDADLVKRSCDFIDRSAEKPFFLWHNSTRCHSFTHLSKKWDGKTGFGLFADAMAELDWVVGALLAKLPELRIADNTIVMFTSDNGAEIFSWPDGGNHPFRGEKGTVYEGGFRVPMLAKWPGVIKPGTIINDVMSAEDWMPTLVAAAGGDPDLKEKLLTGYKVGAKTFRNHLDGYNFKPFFEGKVAASPRHEFFYFSDNADLMAVRYNARSEMRPDRHENEHRKTAGSRYRPDRKDHALPRQITAQAADGMGKCRSEHQRPDQTTSAPKVPVVPTQRDLHADGIDAGETEAGFEPRREQGKEFAALANVAALAAAGVRGEKEGDTRREAVGDRQQGEDQRAGDDAELHRDRDVADSERRQAGAAGRASPPCRRTTAMSQRTAR
jgi:arylsulfatase A-like enzyme